MMPKPRVVVLDYGSGNIHSAIRMLERVGADVALTNDPDAVASCDGLFVPGVGNFHACITGLRAAGGEHLIASRLANQAPVLGVCVGMQVLFAGSSEPSDSPQPGLGVLTGQVSRLQADVVPHMGWSQVEPPRDSALFAGCETERFYFVHSFAVDAHEHLNASTKPTYATHGNRFVAAIEDGALSATQFHPEKSGDAGATLLRNWISSL